MVLVCCEALLLNRKVSAASEGKITGNVKFEGAPPHMRGIDMSKDPWCVKANAANPAHLETTIGGSGGGLENVLLYIDGWSGDATVAKNVPVFDQKNCVYTPHVLPLDVNQTFKVTTSDQTAHNVHPLPDLTINLGWNQSQRGCAPGGREELEKPRSHSGAVQHSSLDAWVFGSCQRAVCGNR